MRFKRFRRGTNAVGPTPEIPRSTHEPLELVSVHSWGRSTERLSEVALPAEGLDRIGPFVHVGLDGPGLLRPGDRSDPSPVPLRSVAELTVVRAGEKEFRDSLGNRGVLGAGQVRLVSGGAGVMSEIGPSRNMTRDGGDHHAITVRWLQPGPPAVPTVRAADGWPRGTQQRSSVRFLVGGGSAGEGDASAVNMPGAVGSPGGERVWDVDVASGATVDLPVAAGVVTGLVVRRGRVLVGDDLTVVQEPTTALLSPTGSEPGRLTLATHLEGDDGASVLVLMGPALPNDMVHSHTLVAGVDAEDLQVALETSRTTGYGSLPRLDG